jgi:transposase
MSDLLSAPRGELLKLVYDLIEENQTLKVRISELQDQSFKLQEENRQLREILKVKGKPDRPSFIKPSVKKKPKDLSLRKKRERGFARRLDLPTRQEFHSYEVCPDCGGSLGKPSVAYKRQVIDLPQASFVVTEHVVFKRFCAHCQKRVFPKLNLQETTVGHHRFGLNVFTTIATLRERLRLPIRVIKLYFKTFYQLDLAEGEITEILHKAASLAHLRYQEILTSLKSSPFLCCDETGFRERGKNGYLWNITTPNQQLILYRQSRGSKVVREIIGKDGQDYEGVIVSDFYSAYNEHAGFHQRCWAHLLRDIRELREDYPCHPPLNLWAKRIKAIYQEAKEYAGPDSSLPLGLQARERIQKETYFKEKLQAICEPYPARASPMSPLSGRMMTFLPELFTFIRFPNIPSTNNLAERTLRHYVVQRKIFGGTRSAKGSQTKAILGSLFGTWNLQGLNPLREMRLLLARAPCQ